MIDLHFSLHHTVMNSAAFLPRGIAPTPPLPASGLSLTFRHLSFNGGAQSQRCNNNGLQIRCARISRARSSDSGSGGFPFGNAKMALQSLLCFSFDTATEPETKYISAEKKKALQTLLGENNPEEAVRIMTKVCKKYQRSASASIKYDATFALVQILIHIGTTESLNAAIGHLNDIEIMTATDSLPSDAKRPFYKAVIYTLLEENGDAQNFWKIYTRAIDSGPPKR